MPKSLVAMSSAAIAAVYFAGLTLTRGADADLNSPASLAIAPETPSATVSPASTVAPAVSAPPGTRRQTRGRQAPPTVAQPGPSTAAQPGPSTAAQAAVPTPAATVQAAPAPRAYADGTF